MTGKVRFAGTLLGFREWKRTTSKLPFGQSVDYQEQKKARTRNQERKLLSIGQVLALIYFRNKWPMSPAAAQRQIVSLEIELNSPTTQSCEIPDSEC